MSYKRSWTIFYITENQKSSSFQMVDNLFASLGVDGRHPLLTVYNMQNCLVINDKIIWMTDNTKPTLCQKYIHYLRGTEGSPFLRCRNCICLYIFRVEEGGCPFNFNMENVYLKLWVATCFSVLFKTCFSVLFKTIKYSIHKGVFRIHKLLVSSSRQKVKGKRKNQNQLESGGNDLFWPAVWTHQNSFPTDQFY